MAGSHAARVTRASGLGGRGTAAATRHCCLSRWLLEPLVLPSSVSAVMVVWFIGARPLLLVVCGRFGSAGVALASSLRRVGLAGFARTDVRTERARHHTKEVVRSRNVRGSTRVCVCVRAGLYGEMLWIAPRGMRCLVQEVAPAFQKYTLTRVGGFLHMVVQYPALL